MPNQRIITIDIQTLPAEPGDFFLNEKDKTQEAKLQEAHRKTALNGDFGRLLCIGYSEERAGEPVAERLIGWDNDGKRLHADEALMLEEFWRTMAGFDARRDIIVGHNIFDFDLRFITKRSSSIVFFRRSHCRLQNTVRSQSLAQCANGNARVTAIGLVWISWHFRFRCHLQNPMT